VVLILSHNVGISDTVISHRARHAVFRGKEKEGVKSLIATRCNFFTHCWDVRLDPVFPSPDPGLTLFWICGPGTYSISKLNSSTGVNAAGTLKALSLSAPDT